MTHGLSKFKADYKAQATKLCRLGATNDDLAKFFEIDIATLYRWMERHPAFRDAIKAGREYADAHVGESLYQRAVGYSHPEEKIFVHDGKAVRVKTVKHYPPDATAMIFWLKNRRPDLWRDKKEVEIVRDVAQMSDDQLESIARGDTPSGSGGTASAKGRPPGSDSVH